MTYLVNGQEVTKTIDNFKLTYEVANVNVSVGGIPGVRIVRLTPVNPAVGQTLSVVVESKQYPITGIKSITTGPSQEIVPDNMYVISHDTTGYRALIRIHGT
ncbi:MAG: hypothetical protein MJ233_04995 [Mycoplasmoidaceae bacterium]|nr:hypothetical protein [Mycoplasmoidaceae bacterium]